MQRYSASLLWQHSPCPKENTWEGILQEVPLHSTREHLRVKLCLEDVVVIRNHLLGKTFCKGSQVQPTGGGRGLVYKPETMDPALERGRRETETDERTWGRQK